MQQFISNALFWQRKLMFVIYVDKKRCVHVICLAPNPICGDINNMVRKSVYHTSNIFFRHIYNMKENDPQSSTRRMRF